eukprot:7820630-Ditylum_brightwellii.AAC.1
MKAVSADRSNSEVRPDLDHQRSTTINVSHLIHFYTIIATRPPQSLLVFGNYMLQTKRILYREMNNNNRGDVSTVALDEPSLSDSDDSDWDLEMLDFDSLGTFDEWMEAAEERIKMIFSRYFFTNIKPKCLMTRAA